MCCPQPRETHALRYWEQAMKERKLQQDNFSTKLGRSPEKLAMHQGDSYRPKQEERQVADQILSSLCLVYVCVSVAVGYRLIVPYHHWTMGKDVCDV